QTQSDRSQPLCPPWTIAPTERSTRSKAEAQAKKGRRTTRSHLILRCGRRPLESGLPGGAPKNGRRNARVELPCVCQHLTGQSITCIYRLISCIYSWSTLMGKIKPS